MRLCDAPVGCRVFFAEERKSYRIQARSGRYLVCTKPFNLRKTVIYTVVDLQEGVRGTENLVFGFGAETVEQCQEMIDRLEGWRKPETPEETATIRAVLPDWKPSPEVRTEVSHRNRIPLNIVRVVQ